MKKKPNKKFKKNLSMASETMTYRNVQSEKPNFVVKYASVSPEIIKTRSDAEPTTYRA